MITEMDRIKMIIAEGAKKGLVLSKFIDLQIDDFKQSDTFKEMVEGSKYYKNQGDIEDKQRIIIAMALACQAELIIADEPTTALDVTIQKQIMDLLDDIKKEFGTTILLISHDLALVSNYADNISVMYSGHIVEKAPAKDFFRKPLHPYSIALLDSLPTRNPALKLRTIEGSPPSIQEEIFGCKFHPRCCYYKAGVCDVKEPVLTERNVYHFSACFIK